MKPLCIDLFCGLGGWTEGFLAEGYRVVGFDIEQHIYAEARYPAELVIQDVLTLDGAQFKNAACIVASPPCQKYSWMAQPWTLAKREAAWQRWERNSPFGDFHLNDLFNACIRIQQEASQAAGHQIPLIIENVKGAQPWIGRAQWHYGSYYLWGDVPAIMPFTTTLKRPGRNFHAFENGLGSSPSFNGAAHETRHVKNAETQGGSWFNISHGKRIEGNQAGAPQRGDGMKTAAHANIRDGHTHTRHLTNQRESDAIKNPGLNWNDRTRPPQGFNVTNAQRYRDGLKHGGDCFNDPSWPDKQGGVKQHGSGPEWFDNGISKSSSRSDSRKAASALIAKIPFELSSYIARVYKP